MGYKPFGWRLYFDRDFFDAEEIEEKEIEEEEEEERINEDELPSIIEDMSDFLAAANWPGDLEEFERIGLYALDRTTMGYTLQVDVLPKKFD